MFSFNRKIVVTCAIAALAVGVQGCWNPFGVEKTDPVESEYYEYCDSAWKVVANLQYSYIARDLDKYMDCFRSDFEFHLLQVDWADYDGDGIEDQFWGRDLEEQFTEFMFDSVDTIELTFNGTPLEGYPWSGSPDTLIRELNRTFDLKVYIGEGGFRATGTARFVCRPDSTGEYYIYLWYDESDT